MARIKSSVDKHIPDPVLEQIRADCAQVLHTQAAEPQLVSRRRFLSQAMRSVIGTGFAFGSLYSAANNAFAQLGTSPDAVPGDTLQDQEVPVIEATSEEAWDGDALNEQIVSEMMDRAMMKLTGLDSAKEAWKDFVLPGDIVGIKINPIGGKELSTNRIIVDKIVDGLYGAGVLRNQIIIWDRFESHLINAGYEINQSDQGVRCFASDSPGVGYDDEVFYETEKDVAVRREKESIKSRYTKIVTQEATVIINVPVLKHHAITGVSGCLKNLAFGSVDNTHRFHSKPLNCDPAISDIFDHPIIKDKVVLNIVDGLLAAFDGGPTFDPNGTWKYSGLLVGMDPVALDQVAFQTVEDKRKELNLASNSRLAKYIRSAWRLGLGTNNLDEMDYQQVKV